MSDGHVRLGSALFVAAAAWLPPDMVGDGGGSRTKAGLGGGCCIDMAIAIAIDIDMELAHRNMFVPQPSFQFGYF